MTTFEKIKIMQAWVDGKTIQLKLDGTWTDWNRSACGEPHWTWGAQDYRIKPEPMEIEVWVNGTKVSTYEGMGPEWSKKKFREVV